MWIGGKNYYFINKITIKVMRRSGEYVIMDNYYSEAQWPID